ncbi:hypothetical protein GCM10023147_42500 [Tsukamurella soli]|uniref:Subtilisin inhibitor-like n=1 Tax=Tsukamurella soli TaxID=644556 RepID=A0ABP8K8J9_9ACTN
MPAAASPLDTHPATTSDGRPARQRRIGPTVAATLGAGGLALVLTACGGSGSTASAPSPTGTTASVAGTTSSSASASASATPAPGRLCGHARGPEGQLEVRVLTSSAPVKCADLIGAAQAYGPQIAQAKPVTIGKWHCTLGTVPAMLGMCNRGDQAFGLFVKQ